MKEYILALIAVFLIPLAGCNKSKEAPANHKKNNEFKHSSFYESFPARELIQSAFKDRDDLKNISPVMNSEWGLINEKSFSCDLPYPKEKRKALSLALYDSIRDHLMNEGYQVPAGQNGRLMDESYSDRWKTIPNEAQIAYTNDKISGDVRVLLFPLEDDNLRIIILIQEYPLLD